MGGQSLQVRKGALALLLLLAALCVAGYFYAQSWRPDRTLYPVQGVALGAANGPIHWGRLRAGGADFAYLDATFGAGREDARFLANRDGARAAKMRFGAVHHYDLCALASDQAGNFDRLVPRDADALPVAVVLDYAKGCDVRPTQAMFESELGGFLAQIESHMGRKAMLAPSAAVVADYDLRPLKRPLWLTRPFRAPDEGQKWRLWQASTRARIDGADGNVRWIVINPVK